MESTIVVVLALTLIIGMLLLAWELFRSQRRNRTYVRLYRIEIQHLKQREYRREQAIARTQHELRGPITVISGWADSLLSQRTHSAPEREALMRILRASHSLSKRVEELLDDQRLRANLQLSLCDVSSIANQVIADFVIAYPGCEIASKIQPGAMATTDGDGFERIFTELLHNAVTHCDSAHPIFVELSYGDEKIIIKVRNGIRSNDVADVVQIVKPQERVSYGQSVITHWSSALDAKYEYEKADGTYLATLSLS